MQDIKRKKILKVFLGIGTNKGDRKKNIQIALSKLSKHREITISKISSMIKNPPQEGIKTGYFLNGAIEILTTLSPKKLLRYCQEIEYNLGRIKNHEVENRKKINKSRTIDLDILFYGNKIITSKDLTIPHPRLHKRYFVLLPLMDIDKYFIHPELKKTVQCLYLDLTSKTKIPA